MRAQKYSILPVLMLWAAALLCTHYTAAFSQTIDDCIECHMDVNLTRTDAQGKIHSLYVDKEKFIASVHGEMDYTCVDCHEGVKADSHPEGGIPDVTCEGCHEEPQAHYESSRHGRFLKEGNPDAPRCYDCHTKHEVFYGDNPQASIHPDNLITTCGACHPEQARSPLYALIAFRVKGHGKVNLSCEYSTRRCGSCHFEVINHGNDELEPQQCADCHGTDKSSALFGTIHKAGVFSNPLLTVLLLALYAAGIAGLVFYFKSGTTQKEPADTENQGS